MANRDYLSRFCISFSELVNIALVLYQCDLGLIPNQSSGIFSGNKIALYFLQHSVRHDKLLINLL